MYQTMYSDTTFYIYPALLVFSQDETISLYYYLPFFSLL